MAGVNRQESHEEREGLSESRHFPLNLKAIANQHSCSKRNHREEHFNFQATTPP
ncbi:MAG: hypothetical protein NPIRA06_15110 [Nitrospirales bacterium]|nr:MAG: hypothetical protein NPIRA06_15110 [Nitrospirales bacterium]